MLLGWSGVEFGRRTVEFSMLVNLLAIILILLLTGFYARQGLFSALITLITAIFASLLAMALYEPLSGLDCVV